jgi:hypothetical protein
LASRKEAVTTLHIVQFSGGAASSYVAYLIAKEHPDSTILLFHDTKAEHPDAYRFRRHVADNIRLPITEVSDGRDLWQVIEDNHCMPNSFIPFCTRVLKLEPGEKYLSQLKEPYLLYNGFGPDEWQRVQRSTIRAEAQGRTVKSPLFELGITSDQAKRIIREEWRICLPEPYQYLEHNNCIPCFKAGKGHWYRVWKYYPEQFQKAKKMEKKIGHTVFKDTSLEELERVWELTKGQLEFDFGDDGIPCICAV